MTRPTERSAAWKAGFRAGLKAAAAECERVAADHSTDKPVPDEFVEMWKKTIDGKTLNNTRSSAAMGCASAVRRLRP